MTSPLIKLAAISTALSLAIALAAAPAAADPPPCVRVLSIAGSGMVITEGTAASVTITDHSHCDAAGTVTYQAVPVAGPHGEPPTPNDNDYDGAAHVLTWTANGPDTQPVTIPIYLDDVADDNERFAITLTNPTGDVTIADGMSIRTGRIPESRELPGVEMPPQYGCMRGACMFVVTTSLFMNRPVEVRWETLDGTAKGGVDFVGVKSGKLVIPVGKRVAVGTVDLLDGDPSGKDEVRFQVHITGASVGKIGRDTTEITVRR